MSYFRKKPVVIEAVQFTGGWDSAQPILEWMREHRPLERSEPWWGDGSDEIAIYTLEGRMAASPGDWIIRGVKGEFYPCKPDIFEATYEEVQP